MSDRSGESFLRKHYILQLVPRHPRTITTAELERRLREQFELSASRRTIQRDIEAIQIVYPLERSDSAIPEYFWPDGAATELVPGHDDYSALTWNLLEEYLLPMIPASMADQTRPAFETARRFLEQSSRQKIRQWRQRVRIIPRALNLRPPNVTDDVQAAVYQALWEQEALKVRYASRSGNGTRELSLHPQGLVIREGVSYLLAVVDGYDDLRQFALHRFEQAESEYRDARMIRDFDLDEYISNGGFSYVLGDEIDLVMHMSSDAAHHLGETPLSDNQTIRELDDGRMEISARVLDTLQLRWWLLGFASGIEVRSPAPLRKFMADEARAMMDRYRD